MPKKSKKEIVAVNAPQKTPDVQLDTLKLLQWFKKEVLHGKPCEMCLECKVSILDEEPAVKHQSHIKFQWNAGHGPLQSKAQIELVDAILKLYINYL